MQTTPKKLSLLTFVLLFAIACPSLAARVIYVDTDATGANDGSSWPDAYNYLQDALTDANSVAKPVEIRVAQGLYRPDQGTDQHLEDRTATFQLRSAVVVKGGYAGFGKPDPDARNVEKYQTVLTGEISDDEDTCHVVTGSGADATAVLDGFTITAGRASSSCERFLGGGMYNYGGSPTVANCTFIDNWALNYGGGMCNDGNSCPLVMNCTFIGNSATDGGAVDNEYSNPTLKNCLFIGNWVDEYNADEFSGGAMYNFHSSPVLINCTVYGNEVRQWWDYCGGIFNRGDDSRPTLTNCILWGNIDQYEDIQQAQIAGGLPIVNYCCIQGLKGDFPGSCNIGADPCFVSQGFWEGTHDDKYEPSGLWIRGDYHMTSQAGRYDPNTEKWVIDDVTSLCIDVGDPMSPIGLEPFPNGGIVNMGAYGGTAEASKSYFGKPPCETIVAGDINGDCEVNFRDFCIMALHWCEDYNL